MSSRISRRQVYAGCVLRLGHLCCESHHRLGSVHRLSLIHLSKSSVESLHAIRKVRIFVVWIERDPANTNCTPVPSCFIVVRAIATVLNAVNPPTLWRDSPILEQTLSPAGIQCTIQLYSINQRWIDSWCMGRLVFLPHSESGVYCLFYFALRGLGMPAPTALGSSC